MRRKSSFRAGLLALVLALSAVAAASAQVTGLYYQEVEKDGRVYVFNTPEKYRSWEESGDMGVAISLIGRGANGETVVAENETALDLYLFKHSLPAYDRPTPKPAAPAAPAASPSKLGIRVYADLSSKQNKDEGTGNKSGDSGVGVDVKRTYFTYTHQFDKVWSATFQSDIGDQGAKRYDVFVKKAYVEAKLQPMATFRLGSADTPWIPFVEGVYGLRYVENTITDALSLGTSADWGLHVTGSSSTWGYQLSLVNGRGYSNPGRSKTVDFEGRISATPVKGLTLAVGGYSGKRGLSTDAAPAKHTATRQDALIAYSAGAFKIGGEYFQAKNWNTVTSTNKDKADGFSAWAQFAANPEWAFFARYDQADPSKDLKPNLQFTYYNAGAQWTINKAFTASLVYKHADVEGGTVGTSNGTIGSGIAGRKGNYDEIGVFTVYNF